MQEIEFDKVAAIDLGSNSFHMIIAAVEDQKHLRFFDRHSVKVRLRNGLDEQGNITPKAMDKAFQCLREFAQIIGKMPEGSVQIYGTNTLRQAKNGKTFIKQAQSILGHPVEIISGKEEARLIYLGVAHTLAITQKNRLVVDIGGGSTEIIIGQGFQPELMESLEMGCVSLNHQFFKKDRCDSQSLQEAVKFARGQVLKVHKKYKRMGWQEAIGASGSVKSIQAVLKKELGQEDITLGGMQQLLKLCAKAKHFDALSFSGLTNARKPTFVAGLCVLTGVFEQLGIEHMRFSDGALREGALYDLIGRYGDEDVREATIRFLQQRYMVDIDQANRVKQTVLKLASHLELPKFALRQLQWAASIHELGLAISQNRHHAHGAYLVEFSDLPGFSQQEQQRVALLVHNQRKSLKMDQWPDLQESLTQDKVLVLRLAVILHRDHSESSPEARLERQGSQGQKYQLTVSQHWLDERPLTQADLQEEQELLKKYGIRLTLQTS